MPPACYCSKPNQPSRVYFAPVVSKPRTQDKTSSKAVPGGDRKSHSEELSMPFPQRTSTTKPPHMSWFHPSSPSSSSPSLAGIHGEPPGCNCRVTKRKRVWWQQTRTSSSVTSKSRLVAFLQQGFPIQTSHTKQQHIPHLYRGLSGQKIKLLGIAHAVTDQSMLLIKL